MTSERTETEETTEQGWDVRLHCNRCHKNIGTLRQVLTNKPDETGRVRQIMREHEVEEHGGKS